MGAHQTFGNTGAVQDALEAAPRCNPSPGRLLAKSLDPCFSAKIIVVLIKVCIQPNAIRLIG